MRRINAKHLYRPAAELATTYKAQAKGDQDNGNKHDHSRAACPAQGPPLLPDADIAHDREPGRELGRGFLRRTSRAGLGPQDWELNLPFDDSLRRNKILR